MSGITGTLTDANKTALDAISNDALNKQKLANQSLGQDAFLELMMTQLAHQDPLSPMDNQEMIAQMAQFSSVEQMGLINENTAKTVEQNDMILDALLQMAKGIAGDTSSEKIDELITKTEQSNESNTSIMNELITRTEESNAINTNVLNELIKLNKAFESYNG